MTALLQCDGCGTVVGERADDEDPTRTWWCLSPAPSISAQLLPVLDLSAVEGAAELMGEPDERLDPLEPPRHFCGEGCILVWAQRRAEAAGA